MCSTTIILLYWQFYGNTLPPFEPFTNTITRNSHYHPYRSYACGGVRAASENKDLGLIEHWLKNIRDVQRLHSDELSRIDDPEQKHRRLVELNIQEQCFNLYGNSIVQQMQAKTGRPRIHGMVYDIADGMLKYLDIDFKSQIKKYRSIYAVADFRRYQPIDVREAVRHGVTADEGKEIHTVSAAEQEKMTKLLFETIDTDRDGIISKEEIRLAMRQYVDVEMSERDLEQAMEPILYSTPHDDINYEQFHEIMDSLHGAGVKEKDDSDRLVVIRPMSGQVRLILFLCDSLVVSILIFLLFLLLSNHLSLCDVPLSQPSMSSRLLFSL
jgi:hypothetical protein